MNKELLFFSTVCSLTCLSAPWPSRLLSSAILSLSFLLYCSNRSASCFSADSLLASSSWFFCSWNAFSTFNIYFVINLYSLVFCQSILYSFIYPGYIQVLNAIYGGTTVKWIHLTGSTDENPGSWSQKSTQMWTTREFTYDQYSQVDWR